jgi:hypothetical protein
MPGAKKSKRSRDQDLTKELEDTFPASDPPSISQPGGGITGAEVALPDEQRLKMIRERAYAIWLDEGQPHGRDPDHWREAELEIDREGNR